MVHFSWCTRRHNFSKFSFQISLSQALSPVLIIQVVPLWWLIAILRLRAIAMWRFRLLREITLMPSEKLKIARMLLCKELSLTGLAILVSSLWWWLPIIIDTLTAKSWLYLARWHFLWSMPRVRYVSSVGLITHRAASWRTILKSTGLISSKMTSALKIVWLHRRKTGYH